MFHCRIFLIVIYKENKIDIDIIMISSDEILLIKS